jgi:predicted lipoprotein
MRSGPGNLPLILKEAAGPAKPVLTPEQLAKQALAAKAVLASADQFIIPAYRSLAETTAAQEKAWAAFAGDRAHGNFAALRTAYNKTCDAWARAQIVKTGPISVFLRYDRFAYWPEARNVTTRMLDALLKSRNPKDLSAETLAHDSVAAQGLTALERLLYDGDMPEALLKAPGDAGTWRVTVGNGIAVNLATIAKEVLAEWTAPDGVRAMIAADKPWKAIFAGTQEAASLFLTDLVGAYRVMHDVKLLPVMGADADAAKPRSAEAWRSGRTQRDLALNLSATEEMTKPFAAEITPAHRAKLESLFAAANKAVAAAPADLGDAAADPKRRPRVEAARVAIKAVQTEIATSLPDDLGITLGFNSLDGD